MYIICNIFEIELSKIQFENNQILIGLTVIKKYPLRYVVSLRERFAMEKTPKNTKRNFVYNFQFYYLFFFTSIQFLAKGVLSKPLEKSAKRRLVVQDDDQGQVKEKKKDSQSGKMCISLSSHVESVIKKYSPFRSEETIGFNF